MQSELLGRDLDDQEPLPLVPQYYQIAIGAHRSDALVAGAFGAITSPSFGNGVEITSERVLLEEHDEAELARAVGVLEGSLAALGQAELPGNVMGVLGGLVQPDGRLLDAGLAAAPVESRLAELLTETVAASMRIDEEANDLGIAVAVDLKKGKGRPRDGGANSADATDSDAVLPDDPELGVGGLVGRRKGVKVGEVLNEDERRNLVERERTSRGFQGQSYSTWTRPMTRMMSLTSEAWAWRRDTLGGTRALRT